MHRSARAIALAFLFCTATMLTFALPAAAGSWDDIRADVYAGKEIQPAGDIVHLTAPMRPKDQSAVPVEMDVRFVDGRTIAAVTLIVDENPAPIAARFDIGGERDHLRLATNLRLNSATQVRAIVEASDGTLYMADRFVKFAGGQAACSAPPMGSPEEIAATMGRMAVEPVARTAGATPIEPRARLSVMHPNHTGLVLDQLTLLYVPLRIITEMEVRQGDERVFAMQGSISLSQNPVIDFDYRTNGAEKLQVDVRDSDGARWSGAFPTGHGS